MKLKTEFQQNCEAELRSEAYFFIQREIFQYSLSKIWFFDLIQKKNNKSFAPAEYISVLVASDFFFFACTFLRLFIFGPVASTSAYTSSSGRADRNGAIGQACTACTHARTYVCAGAAWRRGAPFHGLTQAGTRAKRAIR